MRSIKTETEALVLKEWDLAGRPKRWWRDKGIMPQSMGRWRRRFAEGKEPTETLEEDPATEDVVDADETANETEVKTSSSCRYSVQVGQVSVGCDSPEDVAELIRKLR